MASTTARRVLATRADGSQTVEEVKGAAGKGAADKKAILNSLRAQVHTLRPPTDAPYLLCALCEGVVCLSFVFISCGQDGLCSTPRAILTCACGE